MPISVHDTEAAIRQPRSTHYPNGIKDLFTKSTSQSATPCPGLCQRSDWMVHGWKPGRTRGRAGVFKLCATVGRTRPAAMQRAARL